MTDPGQAKQTYSAASARRAVRQGYRARLRCRLRCSALFGATAFFGAAPSFGATAFFGAAFDFAAAVVGSGLWFSYSVAPRSTPLPPNEDSRIAPLHRASRFQKL